eukprot:TRINITY_DN2595_c0_g3_i1.p2 TRINITY_DN2595_c0_g3~~TRINITY_DN2595_c0_g3_i1.p2  ORF type:complete len:208 (+),score=91.53 TRINITY_DN2595_c0_g3_i1:66-626(+)
MEEEGPGGNFAPTASQQFQFKVQRLLDQSVPHIAARYVLLLLLVTVYCARVYYAQGYFVVTYGLAIYFLKQLVLFVQPLADPELEEDDEGLPVAGKEYKPFVRKLPEFHLWLRTARALCIAFVMTLIPIFNIPAYWPILLGYFIILFSLTAKKQLEHMWKHKYVPFSMGKKQYDGKNPTSKKEYEK